MPSKLKRRTLDYINTGLHLTPTLSQGEREGQEERKRAEKKGKKNDSVRKGINIKERERPHELICVYNWSTGGRKCQRTKNEMSKIQQVGGECTGAGTNRDFMKSSACLVNGKSGGKGKS